MRPSISLLGVSSWSFLLRRSYASIFRICRKSDLHSFLAGVGGYLTRMRCRRQLSPANRAKLLLAELRIRVRRIRQRFLQMLRMLRRKRVNIRFSETRAP